MEKKLYVLRNGAEPGIYLDWLTFFQKAERIDQVDCQFFVYKTELEEAEESVPYSLKWAFKRAELYLKEVYEEEAEKYINRSIVDIQEQVEDFLPWEEDDEYYDEFYGTDEEYWEEEDSYPTEEQQKENAKKEQEKLDTELRKMLGIREDLHMGTVWLDLILQLAGNEQPRISGRFTGRYYPPSLYGILLTLILDTRSVLEEVKSKHECKLSSSKTWFDTLEYELYRSDEYKELKERFEKNGMVKLDLMDVYHINIDTWKDTKLLKMKPAYFIMQKFLKSGKHTIVDLYHELVNSNAYRESLIKVSGGLINPDLMGRKILEEEENKTLEKLVELTQNVAKTLKEYVVGQDEAIDKLEQAFFNSEKNAISKRRNGPRSAFLFAGPSGVGKTFMAEHFSKALGMDYHRFDMANYATQGTLDELIGISSFYRDSKGGVLTSYVDEHPRSLLLFDEIEKAHPTVIKLFLQILDEGKCFDRYLDTDVSFKECIIIMTTNAGKQLYENAGNEKLANLSDKVIIKGFEEDVNPNTKVPYFPPEIVSRMASHTIIMFNHLKATAIRDVIKRDVERNLEFNRKNYGFDISQGSDIVAATVQFAIGGGGDARNASKLAGKLIDKEIYELFTLREEKIKDNKQTNLKQVSWECDFAEVSEEIRQFYLGEKDCVVPIFKETDKEYTIPVSKRMKVIVVNDRIRFMELIRKENILFAVIDYAFGLKAKEASISITDIKTFGSKALLELKKDNADLPVYILKCDQRYLYSASEQRRLFQMGIEGFIDEDSLTKHLAQAYSDICCKNAMETLYVRHQIMTYATRKEISQDYSSAKIIFYNLKLEMAVDAADKNSFIADELKPNKTWSDIFVSSDVKEELEFFIKYLKNPKEYIRTGARVPKGALMFGPPGTGKTSLAKVVATESSVNFLAVSADELLSGGSHKVHDIFRVARKYAPAVLFIDEIDAIGMSRSLQGANSVLNALLTEMDGFKKMDGKPVFVMAATNLKEIDAALVRRFDRAFVVGLPDKEGRLWMLKRLLAAHEKMFCISQKEIDSLVMRSVGLSPADLENIIETALREGIRSGKPVTDELLDEVFEKTNYGEKKQVSSEKEVEHTAYHEAGHAIIELYYGRVPEYMSVIARSNYGGYVATEKLTEHPTKEILLQRICTCMGGRAAELEFGYGVTPGASGDLRSATKQATSMVCEYGMYEEEIGLMVLSEEEYKNNEKARNLVNKILSEQLAQARKIICENKEVVVKLVDAVLHNEQKYLTKKDIMDTIKESDISVRYKK